MSKVKNLNSEVLFYQMIEKEMITLIKVIKWILLSQILADRNITFLIKVKIFFNIDH